MSTRRIYKSFPLTEQLSSGFLENHETVAFLKYETGLYNTLIGIGCMDSIRIGASEVGLEQFKAWRSEKQDHVFGHFSYELKNELHGLNSKNENKVGAPQLFFFQPRFLVKVQEDKLEIGYLDPADEKSVDFIHSELIRSDHCGDEEWDTISLNSRVSRSTYFDHVKRLQDNIAFGDIYEVNYCIEQYQENCKPDLISCFDKLMSLTEAPFSCYYKFDGIHVLCGSPERFLKLSSGVLTSEPMKGTMKRGDTGTEDAQLRAQLAEDAKERAENVMIVDLVRNDLSKHARKNSVNVDELFTVKTFKTAHQMVSRVSARPKPNIDPVDLIQDAFPMGSMTGAPKVRAMELIDEHEEVQRGIYSGSIGYFEPDGEFDLNVVIRSIIYNEKTKYLSLMVGGAITAASDPQKEYAECLLKAEAMEKALNR